MSTVDRVERIRQQLQADLSPQHIDIIDESHKHAGHAGGRDGRGHFAVTIVSEKFAGQSLIQRHRMVNNAMRDLLQTDIHALSIQARTPAEFTAG